MNRSQLEHILRASAAITGADSFVLVGSQAVLGQFPSPPQDLTHSYELDLYSLRSAEDTELIEGSIGEGSPFHQTFGYYAHGVGPETAVLPEGWKERLIPVKTPSTGGATGWCPEIHDLAASKLLAGRDNDLRYVGAALKHGLIKVTILRERVGLLPVSDTARGLCEGRIDRLERTPM